MALKKPGGKTEATVSLDVTPLHSNRMHFKIICVSSLIYNAVPLKARQVLLLPGGRKNEAEKAANLKHNPMEEYRNSVYRMTANDAPTKLSIPCNMFKAAMRSAALDLPGVTKAGIGRLIWVDDEYAPLWGIPRMLMSVVRSADPGHTPDIRTRAIVDKWATQITVRFVTPLLRDKTVADLLMAAGMVAGIGDFRQEKGAGSHGMFRICANAADDEEWDQIVQAGGREEQEHALEAPEYSDYDTQVLFEWFGGEVARRGREADLAAATKAAAKPGKAKQQEPDAELERVAAALTAGVKGVRRKKNSVDSVLSRYGE